MNTSLLLKIKPQLKVLPDCNMSTLWDDAQIDNAHLLLPLQCAGARHSEKPTRHAFSWQILPWQIEPYKHSQGSAHLRPTPVKSKCDWQFLKGDTPCQHHRMDYSECLPLVVCGGLCALKRRLFICCEDYRRSPLARDSASAHRARQDASGELLQMCLLIWNHPDFE